MSMYNVNRSFLQEGKKLDFVVRVQSAKGIPKRYTVSSAYSLFLACAVE